MISKFFSKTRAPLMALIALGAAGVASAQQTSNYVGASVGLYNKYSLRCVQGSKCDDTPSAGGKIFGGHMFSENFGLEASAFGTKSAFGAVKDVKGTTQPGSVNLRGLGLSGVAAISEGPFTFKGRLGVAYTQGKASYASSGVQSKESGLQPLIGAGVSYDLSKQLALNADFDRISGKYNDKAKAHANMVSVGLSYKF